MKVENIFMTRSYDITDSKKVPLIMNWLGHEGIHFVQTLADEEQEICKSCACIFKCYIWNLNQTNMKLFPYYYNCKLSRDKNKNAEEWMDCLRGKADKCNYNKVIDNWRVVINGINDEIMTAEITKGINFDAKEQWHYEWISVQMDKED